MVVAFDMMSSYSILHAKFDNSVDSKTLEIIELIVNNIQYDHVSIVGHVLSYVILVA